MDQQQKVNDLTLAHDTCFIVAGPSGAGKTQWVMQLLKAKQEMFNRSPDRLIWCQGIEDYDQEQKVLQAWSADGENKPIIFLHEFPANDFENFFHPHDLVVVDDMQHEVSRNSNFTSMFTKLAHHKPLCCIYLCQNLFHKSDGESRSRSLSAGYICLMRNIRDRSSVANLAKQMFPGQPQLLTKIFADATREPYSYLFLDLRQETPDCLRFRAKIMPPEAPQVVYCVNNYS